MQKPTILVTTDLSPEAARAFAPAAELCRELGGRIHLMHVVEVNVVAPHGAPLAPPQTEPDGAERIEAAKRELAELAGRFGGLDVETTVVEAGDVAAAVAQRARELDAAFVATSTHGRSGLRRLILGSTAEQIVRHSDVPVICYPAKD